jgi:hypothetical protein
VEDADVIARVHVATWRVAYDGIVDAAYLASLTVDTRLVKWRERLERPRED